jgi:hypothetical protein
MAARSLEALQQAQMERGKEWIRVVQVKRVYLFSWAQSGSVVLIHWLYHSWKLVSEF